MSKVTLSDQGLALKEILTAAEASDAEMKRLGELLLREIEKKEALMVCFHRLAMDVK